MNIKDMIQKIYLNSSNLNADSLDGEDFASVFREIQKDVRELYSIMSKINDFSVFLTTKGVLESATGKEWLKCYECDTCPESKRVECATFIKLKEERDKNEPSDTEYFVVQRYGDSNVVKVIFKSKSSYDAEVAQTNWRRRSRIEILKGKVNKAKNIKENSLCIIQ